MKKITAFWVQAKIKLKKKTYLKGLLSHRLLTMYSKPHSIKASYNCL